jgi:hypothetical protein
MLHFQGIPQCGHWLTTPQGGVESQQLCQNLGRAQGALAVLQQLTAARVTFRLQESIIDFQVEISVMVTGDATHVNARHACFFA